MDSQRLRPEAEVARRNLENPDIFLRQYLSERLNYDQGTGVFTWKTSTGGVSIGSIAGCVKGNRYVKIKVGKKLYYAHRLAFFLMTGNWPAQDVDHINENKTDNSWSNLRELSRAENMNHFHTERRKEWRAQWQTKTL